MENNERVFVSPGMYTSERDLTFVTNNIGVTTLGLVGETLKGPAFQPIFVSNKAEMRSFFGGKSPKKYKDTGFLRYELPFTAEAYLENSNQLYVTRVLGLTGYDAGAAYAITAGDKTVALLRSRASYTTNTLNFKASDITISATPTLDADFTLTVTLPDATTVDYTVSLDKTKKNYITRVLGRSQDDGKTAIYVEEIYPNYIDSIAESTSDAVVALLTFPEDFKNYKTKYKAAYTPYIVSEVKGGVTTRLFRFETISDGDSANDDIKISFTNIKPDEREFDVEIRKMYDSDNNPAILERYSKCTMDPTSKNFIGRKIGTVDGEFEAISSYVLIELNDEEDTSDSFPAGFEGYIARDNVAIPEIMYKSSYNEFENKRRKYLGISEKLDIDILKFKGADAWTSRTKGFHLDSGAGADYVVGAGEFRSEAEIELDTTNPYKKVYSRKFTVAPAGGFDGWDIYRTGRTNTDKFTIQRVDPALVGDGLLFEKYELSDGDTGITSDYYAFLEGVRTFSNPKAVDINVFATPGIDLINNASLSEYTIDVIERERGDSIYIATTPDISYGSKMTAQEIANELADQFDSNYTATYWPWIQKFDTETNISVFMSPTSEVVKNIALTDNVAHPWWSTAGFKFGNVEAKQARHKLTQVQSDILYENRINPISTFPGDGIKIMGNKNLQIADTALNRLNVRRLLLRARKLISAVGVRLLFQPNDTEIRDEFLRQVNPILENMRKERGLQNFKVELDPVGPEGNDRNTLNGRIRIQPTDAVEYINISFDVTQNGASFEDI